MTRRQAFKNITLITLAPVLLRQPAWAGHEIDNAQGRRNGRYVATKIRVTEPDKEEITLKKTRIELSERYVLIYLKDRNVNCRVDQIYSMGYKLEISANDPGKPIRYFIIVEGNFE